MHMSFFYQRLVLLRLNGTGSGYRMVGQLTSSTQSTCIFPSYGPSSTVALAGSNGLIVHALVISSGLASMILRIAPVSSIRTVHVFLLSKRKRKHGCDMPCETHHGHGNASCKTSLFFPKFPNVCDDIRNVVDGLPVKHGEKKK